MGYRTMFWGNLNYKDGITKEQVQKDLEEFKKDDEVAHLANFISLLKEGIEFDLQDSSYAEEQLAPIFCFIAKYVNGEDTIDCEGDEAEDLWRVSFDGKGNYHCEYGTTIYDHDPYKEFMDKFGDELPPKLKAQIEQWNAARHI